MSDKKTIQEALAEVQKNSEFKKAEQAKQVWGEALQIDEANPFVKGFGKTTKISSAKVKPQPSSRSDFGLGPETKSTKTIDLKTSEPSKPSVPAVGETPKTSSVLGKAALGAAAGYGAYKAYDTFSKDKGVVGPAPDKFTPDTPKAAEAPKAAEPTKTAPDTFGKAFAAARKAASEKGSKATGQFEFKGKKYQTNIQGTGTAKKPEEKYVSMGKQTKVDVGSTKPAATPETPKAAEPPKVPEAPKVNPPKEDTGVAARRDIRQGSQDVVGAGLDVIAGRSGAGSRFTSGASQFASGMGQAASHAKNVIQGVAGAASDRLGKNAQPEYESGNLKKGKTKMSEETNPLIAAFLKLQETKAANMFEAAKKAKKDYDEDGEVESPKDEVWGSRFKAAKAAGKMEEGSMMDPNDPSVQGGSDVTSTPAKKAPASRMSMPTAPKTDSSVQGSGDVTKGGKPASIREAQIDEIKVSTAYSYAGKKMEKERKGLLPGEGEPTSKTELKNMKNAAERTDKDYYKKRGFKKVTATEEVEFSQAEIDHLNSFFEAVAPSRAEPTKGVNPSVSNISLTDDTLEEGRPKKNPTPETSERDARQHIQVIAGRAAAGNTLDFPHNDGSKSKITPAMGRKIVSHLQGLKPAERQAAVNKMHASSEGLKI